MGLSTFCGDEHNQPRYPLDNEIHAQTDEMLLISLQNLDNGIRNVAWVVRQAIDNIDVERKIAQGAIKAKRQSQQTEGDKQDDSVPIVFLCFKQGVSTILLGERISSGTYRSRPLAHLCNPNLASISAVPILSHGWLPGQEGGEHPLRVLRWLACPLS